MIGMVSKYILGEEDDGCDNDIIYNYTTNAARCAYIQRHIEDCVGESLINYYDLFYCKFQESYLASVIFTVIFWSIKLLRLL